MIIITITNILEKNLINVFFRCPPDYKTFVLVDDGGALLNWVNRRILIACVFIVLESMTYPTNPCISRVTGNPNWKSSSLLGEKT